MSAVAMSDTSMAIEWDQGVNDAWTSVANFIPKLVMFFVVLFVFWLIAKAVAKVIDAVLPRVGFDRAVERAGIAGFFQSSDFTPRTLITKLVYYFILLIGLQMALTSFGSNNPVSEIVNNVVLWLPNAMVAVVIVVIVAAIANVVRELLGGALGSLSYGALLAKIVYAFILALGVIAALNQIGVATTVTTPVLTAVLATAAGVTIVGVGGGLIGPMRSRWESWLDQLATDSQATRQGAHAGPAESHQPLADPAQGQQPPTDSHGQRWQQ